MTLTRRRFLTITAAALLPSSAEASTWQGRAFGADISITIRGPHAAQALRDAQDAIREVEALFSLYDPNSALVRLNRTGKITNPDHRFLAVMAAADHAYTVTNGLFDPTVQPLWNAEEPADHMARIGWNRVRFDATKITLGLNQALTFNGIAQGYATDIVTDILTDHGLTDILVNIGEHRSNGGPWRLGVHDPVHGQLATRTLTTGAIATSSPSATQVGVAGHILHKTRAPQWSTVSVEAPSATLADSLSTAMVLATQDEIIAIKNQTEITRVTLIDKNGDLTTLQ